MNTLRACQPVIKSLYSFFVILEITMKKTFEYGGVKYLGGLPSYTKRGGVRLVLTETEISIHKWGKKRASVYFKDVQDVQVKQYLQLFPPKKAGKSVVGRAILGGFFLGPIGAVVGGISGIGQKDELDFDQTINKDEWVVVIECIDQGIQARCGFIFNASIMKRRKAVKIQERILSLRGVFLKTTLLEVEESKNKTGIEVRLSELKSLYKKGYITVSEYEERRKEIIKSI